MKHLTVSFSEEAEFKDRNQTHLIVSPINFFDTSIQCRKLFALLFTFALGLTIGILIFFHLRSFSFNFKFDGGDIHNLYPSIRSFSRSQLNVPSPPPPPPSPPRPTSPFGNSDSFDDFLKPPKTMHNMSEEELLWRASMTPRIQELPYKKVPKIAFMFLTRGPILLAPFWEKFFKGNEGHFSIYIHSSPSNNKSSFYPQDSVFHDRGIPSKKVEWGNSNLIEAERRLLANALLDFSNQHFVLLSEACIPLFNFSTIYSYLTNTNQNFVELYDQPGPVGRGRYNRNMSPTIEPEQWRKGSQWFAINRDLALEVVSDKTYFPVFQQHCLGRLGCYADEHYLPTLVNIKFGEMNSDRGLTWVDWSKGGPHPTGFLRENVTPKLLEKMREGHKCQYNGEETNQCFMFARKFLPLSLGKLLRIAPKVMEFDS